MAIGANPPPADPAAQAAQALKRAQQTGPKPPATVTGTGGTAGAAPVETDWSATGAANIQRPSPDLGTNELVSILGTQVSSLSARWALRPRQNGESQADWVATVNTWAESRKTASANTPDVDRLVGTLTSSVERLQTLKRSDPKNPEIATLYQGLADAVGPLTSGPKSFDVPESIKARVFEAMLPALDRDLLSGLTDKSNALGKLPPGSLFMKLGAPLFDGLSQVKPERMGDGFIAAASTVAVERDGDTRKQLAKNLATGVMRMYPDVPHETAPELRMPPVGNSPLLAQLFAPQIAHATFFQGTVPDVLVKGQQYGQGAAKINWQAQLGDVGKGGDRAQRALGAMETFIGAQAPAPRLQPPR